MRRIACLLVPRFPAAAAVRAEPALAGRRLAILDGEPPARVVVEATEDARARGAHPAMPEGALRLLVPGVICRGRVVEHEGAAQQALLEVALAHSPRVEDGGPGLVYLDAAGLGSLHGSEAELAERLRRSAAAAGLPARVGIAGSRMGALLAARSAEGVTVIGVGQEALTLAPAPPALLGLEPEMEERLARWGIRTLGELAALPTPALFERLGPEGPRLQALARGEDPRPLRPWAPPLLVEEAWELESPVERLEPVLALLGLLAERVCARLDRQRLAADAFDWWCRLDPGPVRAGRFVPPCPTREVRAVMAVLRASLDARPPDGPVAAVGLRAHPVRLPAVQDALDGRARPAPRTLTETVAKLTALVGPERIGVPALLDSHRPDAVRLEPLVLAPLRDEGDADRSGSVLALGRLRPRPPAAVRLTAGCPVHLRSDRLTGPIVASAGPWRASGEWWLETRWARDEWDVELADGTLCRLAHDGRAWALEGVYD
jgi:protein ImuB